MVLSVSLLKLHGQSRFCRLCESVNFVFVAIWIILVSISWRTCVHGLLVLIRPSGSHDLSLCFELFWRSWRKHDVRVFAGSA